MTKQRLNYTRSTCAKFHMTWRIRNETLKTSKFPIKSRTSRSHLVARSLQPRRTDGLIWQLRRARCPHLCIYLTPWCGRTTTWEIQLNCSFRAELLPELPLGTAPSLKWTTVVSDSLRNAGCGKSRAPHYLSAASEKAVLTLKQEVGASKPRPAFLKLSTTRIAGAKINH